MGDGEVVLQLIRESSGLVDALVLLVDVVVLVRCRKVRLVAGYGQQYLQTSLRYWCIYPIFIIVVMPAPLAPKSCSPVSGIKM